jgi:hypothetical protein
VHASVPQAGREGAFHKKEGQQVSSLDELNSICTVEDVNVAALVSGMEAGRGGTGTSGSLGLYSRDCGPLSISA